ncbi:MAG: M20 family metallopeptidase [Acidaminococcaceae bacterium]|jgi:glutamate carboxypeptidase|nr:M20 family metallopeptidase [Acidaminococcaceae bacterium]
MIQALEKQVLEKVAAAQPEMWQFIEKIVNTDSGYDCPEGVAQVAHTIGSVLEPLGFKVEYHESKGPVQLVATRPRPGKPAVLIMGHMDTVFAKGAAAERPFKIVDGLAYGPGVIDMKSGIGISVYTVKSLLACGCDDVDITFLFAGDEEVNHPDSDAVAMFKKYGRGKTAVFNMEPGREQGQVVYGRKGLWRPVVEVTGIAAHSGNNHAKGASAVLELAHKTIDLFNITDYPSGTTCNVGVFQGGTLPNIMADHAIGKLDVRFKTLAQAEQAQAKVRAICAHNYDARTSTKIIDRGAADYMPPFEVTDGGMKLFHYLQKLSRELGHAPLEGQYVGGSSDACYTTMVGAPTVCGMGPQSEGPHTPTEHSWVASYLPRCELLALALLRLHEL